MEVVRIVAALVAFIVVGLAFGVALTVFVGRVNQLFGGLFEDAEVRRS